MRLIGLMFVNLFLVLYYYFLLADKNLNDDDIKRLVGGSNALRVRHIVSDYK